MLGFLTGAIAGLATITPAAGFVSPASAALIGVLAGAGCYYAVQYKSKKGWDDALDVWGVHGIGGLIGTLALGLLGSTAMNSAGTNGLLRGNPGFFMTQVMGILIATVYSLLVTYFLLVIINKITPVRMKDAHQNEDAHLDTVLHGEIAYRNHD